MIRLSGIGLSLALLLCFFHGLSQTAVTNWINYQQQYLKIPVTNQGLYRIDHSTLQAGLNEIGVSISSVDPRSIQVFARGEEQFLYIAGENDGSFDPGDELLFYGEGNDGWFDTTLYINPSAQPNPYYSLFNDTLWYYLTWNGQTNNRRYQTENNTHFSGKTAATYVWKEAYKLNTSSYNQGHKDGSGVSSPLYGSGEGWVYPASSNQFYQTFVTTRNALISAIGPDATARVVTLGTNNAAVIPNHHLKLRYGKSLSNLTLVKDTTYNGYLMLRHEFKVPSLEMANDVWIQMESPRIDPSLPNSQSFGYLAFRFAHSPSLGGESSFYFDLPANVDTSYLRFTNYSSTSSWVYDLQKGIRSPIVKTGSQIEMLVAPGDERPCYLAPDNSITSVTQLHPISNYRRGKGWFTDYSTLTRDSAFVIITHADLYSGASQYASYRQSQGMETTLELVDELYDQFAYGIQKHPAATRNFLLHLQQIWPEPPAYLFLIGKSVKESQTRKSAKNQALNKVPTLGIPASDNLFSSSLSGSSYVPSIPVGRLAAVDNNQVNIYLNKVRQFEQAAEWNDPGVAGESWKKRGIHVAGGENETQQNVFKGYLSSYGQHWEAPYQSGKIFNFQRFTSGSVQEQEFDSLRILINDGVSLLSFFGHGSGGQLGVNLGNPEDYENRGKYPLFIANSCNVGDYHLPNDNSLTINERWVLAPESGAIGFIASTSLGFPYNLDQWSMNFYQSLSDTLYESSLGEVMQHTIRQVQNPSADENNRSNRTCMEINLHGDPSLKLYPHELPDFAIEREHIQLPALISTDQRFLNLSFKVHNTQRGLDTAYTVQIKRTLPTGEDTLYTLQASARYFSQDLSLTFPIFGDEHIGENRFDITLNPERGIDERNFNNNRVSGLLVQVTSDDLIPVHPFNFAIVPDKNVILRASTADPFAPEREYLFELDIQSDFSSPMKNEYRISAPGGVVEWNPRIAHAPDSVVYYWRCSPAANNAADLRWRESSFQIVYDKSGWGQYAFDQYAKNDIENLEYNADQSLFEFVSRTNNLYAQNKGLPVTGAEWNSIYWSKDGDQQGFSSICRGWPSMMIAVIDPGSLESWEVFWVDSSQTPPVQHNPENSFGNFNGYDLSQPNNRQNCTMPDKKFMFRVGFPDEMDSMVSLLNQHIPDSFYILAYSGRIAHFQTNWQNRHFQAFENLGADSIRFLPDSVPYIFFTQKGNPSKTQEEWGTDPYDFITLTTQVQGNSGTGTMTSPTIGPAQKWREINWNFGTADAADSIYLEVYGLDDQGEHLLGSLSSNQGYLPNMEFEFPTINEYPNLQLKAHFVDSTFNQAPQLKKWHLYFDLAPEIAVAAGDFFSLHADSVLQGDPVRMEVEIKNIGPVENNPMRIEYVVVNSNNQRVEVPFDTLPAMQPGASTRDTLILPTDELTGQYNVVLDVNPLDSHWIPEQEHFNNVLAINTYVLADRTNPLLDVTFDGVHILDGDLVSARPEIGISLNDDNPFKLLNDTGAFEVYLTHPNGQENRIYFNENADGSNLAFTPATTSKNKARADYSPSLTEDGQYKLRVKAADASGNESGKFDYQVHFEVVNKSSITQVMNYPNPFSTSTQFVFTLTGWKVPDYFRIQIMTITGRVVKEIDRNELGHIHIGRNITDYTWDGTDQFGDRLANGVYFYRVITRIEGEEIEHRNSGADNWFKKDFGKMYLMR